jgi:hypothetical protein
MINTVALRHDSQPFATLSLLLSELVILCHFQICLRIYGPSCRSSRLALGDGGISSASLRFQLLVHLKIYIPHQKRERQVSTSPPELPKQSGITLSTDDEIECPRPYQHQHPSKHTYMNQKVAASDVEGRHATNDCVYRGCDKNDACWQLFGTV